MHGSKETTDYNTTELGSKKYKIERAHRYAATTKFGKSNDRVRLLIA